MSWAACAACAGYGVLFALGRVHYVGELASMFRYDFGLAAAFGVIPLLLFRHWKRALFVTALCAWAVWPEASLAYSSQPAEPAASSPRLRVTMANVLRPNKRHGAVFDALLDSSPDVIALIEVSIPWRDAALERLGTEYPFHASGLNTDGWSGNSWGLMVFSKTELTGIHVTPVEHWRMSIRPVLQVTLGAPLPVTLQLAHPERPGRGDRLGARRKALTALGEAEISGERLLLGDLNTTSTSPYFKDLLAATGLRDSRVGFGRQCSWYMGDRLPGPFPVKLPPFMRRGVTIDHALVSEGLYVVERRILLTPGSDHRAVNLTVMRAE